MYAANYRRAVRKSEYEEQPRRTVTEDKPEPRQHAHR